MAEQDDFWPYKIGSRCDIEQYQMLKRCSAAGDTTEWNEWRKVNQDVEIWLSGVDLHRADLHRINLAQAHLEGANFSRAELSGADFENAQLSGAVLSGARLTKAHFGCAHLMLSRMEGARLELANLEGARLYGTHLEDADLESAKLPGAMLWLTHLERARLLRADLTGARLLETHLEGTDASYASVDEKTRIAPASVDENTCFRGVALGACSTDPAFQQRMRDNLRRMGWEDWYRQGSGWAHWVKSRFIRFFWSLSDYGCSTGRILGWFVAFAFLFAVVYYACGVIWPPGLVANLLEVDGQPVHGGLVPLRAAYFSVVTMTTLGFGDMYAGPHHWAGYILLIIETLLGYVLLAALVTRLGVLFTGYGPTSPPSKK